MIRPNPSSPASLLRTASTEGDSESDGDRLEEDPSELEEIVWNSKFRLPVSCLSPRLSRLSLSFLVQVQFLSRPFPPPFDCRIQTSPASESGSRLLRRLADAHSSRGTDFRSPKAASSSSSTPRKNQDSRFVSFRSPTSAARLHRRQREGSTKPSPPGWNPLFDILQNSPATRVPPRSSLSTPVRQQQQQQQVWPSESSAAVSEQSQRITVDLLSDSENENEEVGEDGFRLTNPSTQAELSKLQTPSPRQTAPRMESQKASSRHRNVQTLSSTKRRKLKTPEDGGFLRTDDDFFRSKPPVSPFTTPHSFRTRRTGSSKSERLLFFHSFLLFIPSVKSSYLSIICSMDDPIFPPKAEESHEPRSGSEHSEPFREKAKTSKTIDERRRSRRL